MTKRDFLNIKGLFSWIDRLLFKLPIIGKRLYLRQLTKFIIAGGFLTLVDFAIYIFLTRIFLFWQIHYLWANFVAMSVGAIASFILNKTWVFKDNGKNIVSQYIKFWIVGAVGGMVFYQLLLFYFVDLTGVYDILGKVYAAIIVLFFRFALQKFWIFK